MSLLPEFFDSSGAIEAFIIDTRASRLLDATNVEKALAEFQTRVKCASNDADVAEWQTQRT